ncbi:MAG TPA: Gfo/Idh/MocA family oxidoreductase [Candidatus Dormibacteraeota bacterium]|nr:Gfo/Idh/MocA family oxidoreductase [Candidatus Dormibacteraeota bacterium]
MSEPIRIALVGLDHWYSAFPVADEAARHPEVELCGIAHDDRDRAGELARRVGVERVEQEPMALVEDPAVEAVISFIDCRRNPDVVIAAAERGKHVLSIKPVARTLEEATRVRDAVRKAGIHFLPAESRPRLSTYQRQLRAWFDEGRFGKLISAQASLWAGIPQQWHDDPTPGWFTDPERAPRRRLDRPQHLPDRPPSRAARRGGGRDLGPDRQPQAPGPADGGLRHLHPGLRGRGDATLEDTWTNPGAFQSGNVLVGTEGAVRLDVAARRLSVAGNFDGFKGWVEVAAPVSHVEGLDHFVDLIRGRAEPVAGVDDAWRNLAVTLAFYEAARSRRPVAPEVLS